MRFDSLADKFDDLRRASPPAFAFPSPIVLPTGGIEARLGRRPETEPPARGQCIFIDVTGTGCAGFSA